MKYALAIDIGASSGRHILGWMDGGKLSIEEIYRFENNLTEQGEHLVWDMEHLVKEVKNGIKKCGSLGKIPDTIAIDTWAVDYVLLDQENQPMLPVYSYRDPRTNTADADVEKVISPEDLYSRTGIQKQKFNTIYQLYCDKKTGRLNDAKHFMMIPAYLSYRLTGKIRNEYTNATTTGFVNAKTYTYDQEILDALGFDKDMLGTIVMSQEQIGTFTDAIKQEMGFDATVLFCPSHDTACAVAACPMEEQDIYISSGTWSLIGTELKEPILSEEARLSNFTNEGGVMRRFRFLKNYMGMWLFQCIRRDLGKTMSYDDMMTAAKESGVYEYIDVNAPEFVAPKNMIQAIRTHLNQPEMPVGAVINSVYHSLAKSYKDAVDEVERIANIHAKSIHIVGGGSKDQYLNSLTATYTGKKVTAGPVEATAIGNLISQFMSQQEGSTLEEFRTIIKNSFAIEEVKA